MLTNIMMRQYAVYLGAVVVLYASACSPVKTFVEQTGGEGALGQTYAFFPVSSKHLDQASAVLYSEIRQRIMQEMEKQRYQPDTANPDMLIAFNVMTEAQRKETTRTVDPYPGYRNAWAFPYDTRWASYRYKEIRWEKTGTLILDVLSSDYQLRWRGVGIGPVNNPDERFETSYKVVDKLLKKLPQPGVAAAGTK